MLAHISALISLKVLSACPTDKNNIRMNMRKEQWLNDTRDAKSKYSDKNLSHSHSVQ
jgi:hypothetical protein